MNRSAPARLAAVACVLAAAFASAARAESFAAGALLGPVVAVEAPVVRPVAADAKSAATPGSDASLSVTDRAFIVEAAAAVLYEVEGGRLAVQRGASPSVKAFAAMIVADHEKANDDLRRLAGARGLVLAGDVAPDKRRTLERLAKLTGPDFDREFKRTAGVTEHDAAIGRFSAAAKATRDPKLKGWIEATLPVLRRHLDEAKRLP